VFLVRPLLGFIGCDRRVDAAIDIEQFVDPLSARMAL
jgi:hypothetical protein